VAIDGTPGAPWQLGGGLAKVFRWAPFPESSERLELFYSAAEAPSCLRVRVELIDAECEAENPGPTNCVD